MVALLSAGIAPALALMSFFYLKDRFNTEPIIPIIRAFLYGALLVFPIMFIQYAFIAENIGQNPIVSSFMLTGLLEEFFKWFIFIYTVYKFTAFNSAYDGIIYGVALSLGFATVENILYLFAHGIEYALSRAIFPVSSHALFGVIMGYYLGKGRFNPSHSKAIIFSALIIPVLLHGIYDFILQAAPSGRWFYILIPFMVILWLYGMKKVKMANQQQVPIYHLVKSENTPDL